MSTTNYYPNYPDTTTVYKIGTIGWEYNSKLFKTIDIALDAIRALGSLKEKGFATVASFLLPAGSVMLTEPKYFGSSCKLEPAEEPWTLNLEP